MSRPKHPRLAEVYDGYLALARDPSSSLYLANGQPHRGGGARCAFWDGFAGAKTVNSRDRGTLSHACYRAGRDFAKEQRK